MRHLEAREIVAGDRRIGCNVERPGLPPKIWSNRNETFPQSQIMKDGETEKDEDQWKTPLT